MKKWILAAVLMLPSAAHAEATLAPEVCHYLTAEYQGGVDVNGKPVAPADLDAPVIVMPPKFSFDINVDVAQAAGIPVLAGTQTLARVGTVTYDKGLLTFNGQPLTAENEANLKAICVPKPENKPVD